MADDDPNYPMPPEERLFAPEELRPLEEFPKALTEPLRQRPDLQYHLTAIRKHFLELREEAERRLSSVLGGIAVGSPDHMDKIFAWKEAINRGEVPAAFGNVKLLQAREILADHFYYGELLGLVQLTLERGLWRALPAPGFALVGSEESVAAQSPTDGEETHPEPNEPRYALQFAEAARDMGGALPDFLGAFQLILSLLTTMNPTDLIRGRATVAYARDAGSSPKVARGIQAAASHVYRRGMTEQECWDALLAFINDAPEEDIDADGWYEPEEVAEGRYKFLIDSTPDTVSVMARDIDTGRARSLVRNSFYPYFKSAKKPDTAAS